MPVRHHLPTIELRPGEVALIGAGPAAADLITVRGARLLQQCDVIVHDSLVDPSLYTDLGCELIDVGKRAGNHKMPQPEINELLVRLAKQGRRVVRLKGGDPFVLGRGSEEALFLHEHAIAVYVIPGVTSAVAAAELAGIPVTHRGVADAFTVISAHPRAEDSPFTIPSFHPKQTIILLMGVSSLPSWRNGFVAAGYPEDLPVAFITWAGWPQQRVVRSTLGRCLAISDQIQAPTVSVLGYVAALDAKNTSATS
ncbi:MAG: uroporphyrinogen-III C-methyltransferase [Myxococcales bacterium]|nr:uroporphyrinogen-III C-methyltransferase [Myxococcales bacterium]